MLLTIWIRDIDKLGGVTDGADDYVAETDLILPKYVRGSAGGASSWRVSLNRKNQQSGTQSIPFHIDLNAARVFIDLR